MTLLSIINIFLTGIILILSCIIINKLNSIQHIILTYNKYISTDKNDIKNDLVNDQKIDQYINQNIDKNNQNETVNNNIDLELKNNIITPEENKKVIKKIY